MFLSAYQRSRPRYKALCIDKNKWVPKKPCLLRTVETRKKRCEFKI